MTLLFLPFLSSRRILYMIELLRKSLGYFGVLLYLALDYYGVVVLAVSKVTFDCYGAHPLSLFLRPQTIVQLIDSGMCRGHWILRLVLYPLLDRYRFELWLGFLFFLCLILNIDWASHIRGLFKLAPLLRLSRVFSYNLGVSRVSH